jgi:hypothetical protein
MRGSESNYTFRSNHPREKSSELGLLANSALPTSDEKNREVCLITLAEGEGFEPSRDLRPNTLSKRAP